MPIYNLDEILKSKENSVCFFDSEKAEELLDEFRFYGAKDGKKYPFYLFIDLDQNNGRNFFQKPYMKIGNNIVSKYCTEMSRIYLVPYGGFTIPHNNTKPFKVTAQIANQINIAMKCASVYNKWNIPGLTVRDAMWLFLKESALESNNPIDIEDYITEEEFKSIDFSYLADISQ